MCSRIINVCSVDAASSGRSEVGVAGRSSRREEGERKGEETREARSLFARELVTARERRQGGAYFELG